MNPSEVVVPAAFARGSAQRAAWARDLLLLGLVALLGAEVWALRASLNTDRLLGDERIWARLLLETRYGAPFLISSLAALVLLSGAKLRAERRTLAAAASSASGRIGWGLIHLGLFLAFRLLTGWLLVSFEGDSVAGVALVTSWVLLGMTVPLSLACVGFEPRALLRSLVRLWPALSGAVALGFFVVLASRLVLSSGLWRPLLDGTAFLTTAMLAVLPGSGPSIAALDTEGFRLALGDFDVLVSRECSGFEGLALTSLFLSAYFAAFRERLRFPHVLLLVPLALGAIYLLNGLRLALLVWIGAHVSPEVAMTGFHSYAGWIAFCSLALGIVHVSRRVPTFAAIPGASSTASTLESATVNPAALYLGPFLVLLGTGFLAGAWTGGFDYSYPVRVLACVACLRWAWSELPAGLFKVTRTGLGFGVLGFVVWSGLERLGVQTATPSLPQGWSEVGSIAAGLWMAVRIAGFTLVVPLAEELAFRGFLLRRLSTPRFEALDLRRVTPLAWAASSLAFGLLHGQWVAGILVGGLFALAAMRRGRLGDATVAHATTNALLVLCAPLQGPWYSWL